MKKEHPIRIRLGLTQEEMATLLGITRAHWGMYEIGKRDLPPAANQLLAELLAHLQPTPRKTTKSEVKAQRDQQRLQLEKLLHENQYQQLLLQRQMVQAEKKSTAQQHLPLLADFLSRSTAKNPATANAKASLVLQKIKKTSVHDYDTTLLQQQIKLQTLQFEQQLLESKIKDI